MCIRDRISALHDAALADVENKINAEEIREVKRIAVSYTHLDVYKRQIVATVSFGIAGQVKAADPVPKIGVVDTEKLTTSPRFKQYDEELTRFVEDLRAKLTIRKQKLMLNETEIKELVDLKIKANPTAQDQERIKALEETEKQRDAELKQLQETKDATEQQKARLKELQDMRQKSTDTGEALEKDYPVSYTHLDVYKRQTPLFFSLQT